MTAVHGCAVLLCFVCLTLLASFSFLLHLSLSIILCTPVYIHVVVLILTIVSDWFHRQLVMMVLSITAVPRT